MCNPSCQRVEALKVPIGIVIATILARLREKPKKQGIQGWI